MCPLFGSSLSMISVKSEPIIRQKPTPINLTQPAADNTKTGFSFGKTPRFGESDSAPASSTFAHQRTDGKLGPVREGTACASSQDH